jgi:hypothetical protein
MLDIFGTYTSHRGRSKEVLAMADQPPATGHYVVRKSLQLDRLFAKLESVLSQVAEGRKPQNRAPLPENSR